MLNLLVPVAHGLVVGVLDAALDVAEEQSFTPLEEPLARGVARLHHDHLLLLDLLGFSLLGGCLALLCG